MSLHGCHRTADTDRALCRYDDRLSDRACTGCTLRKPDPPKARAPGWLDRQRIELELWKMYRNPTNR